MYCYQLAHCVVNRLRQPAAVGVGRRGLDGLPYQRPDGGGGSMTAKTDRFPYGTKASFSTVPDCQAVCDTCGWKASTRNALPLAAQHHGQLLPDPPAVYTPVREIHGTPKT